MKIQTRHQRYAKSVYDRVQSISKDQSTRYCALASKLPVLIRTAGLAQALAFIAARGQEEGKLLLKHLAEVLGQQSAETFANTVRTAELNAYMHLTRNTLDALLWFKRYAQSVHNFELGSE